MEHSYQHPEIAQQRKQHFFKNVVKYWGLPRSIISDRDPRFTGKLWKELFKLLGSALHFSTSFHPQTDGQTERVNALLECYLRHFVSANQKDWAKLMDIAQFSYNLQRSEATGRSPFELATGQQPLTPHMLSTSIEGGKCPGAYKMAKSWEEQADLARSCLNKAQRRMKKWADKRRRSQEFKVGDQVFVKILPQQLKAYRGIHNGLVRRYEGPFPVIAKVGKVSYRLDLPSTLKVHPVFHVSMLKPYHEDKEDPTRGRSQRAPPAVTKSFDKEVEEVLTERIERRRGVPPCKLNQMERIARVRSYVGESSRLMAIRGSVEGLRGNEDVATIGGGECHAPLSYVQIARKIRNRQRLLEKSRTLRRLIEAFG